MNPRPPLFLVLRHISEKLFLFDSIFKDGVLIIFSPLFIQIRSNAQKF